MQRPRLLHLLVFLCAVLLSAACDGTGSLGPRSEAAPLLGFGTYGQWLWSHDGSEIFYLSYPYATTPAIVGAVHTTTGARRTLATSPAGSGRRIVSRGLARTHFGVELVLSADGTHLYYLTTTAAPHQDWPQGVQLHRVRVADAAGAAPELVAGDVGFHGYAVSPDMSRIAYNDGAQVRLLDLAGGEDRVLTPGDGHGVVPASWAPDGRSILVMQSRPGSHGRGFAWLDLESENTHEWRAPDDIALGVPPLPYPEVRWFDGRPLILASDTTGRALVRCDVATATCTTVRTLAGSDLGHGRSWSHDGANVLFWRSRCVRQEPNTFWGGTYCTSYSNDLRLLGLENGNEQSVMSSVGGSGPGELPVFAPDGRRIGHTDGYVDRPGTHGLFVRALP
jgi:dipeptidyl aminopeptidase/acylaminoacyl peptidase